MLCHEFHRFPFKLPNLVFESPKLESKKDTYNHKAQATIFVLLRNKKYLYFFMKWPIQTLFSQLTFLSLPSFQILNKYHFLSDPMDKQKFFLAKPHLAIHIFFQYTPTPKAALTLKQGLRTPFAPLLNVQCINGIINLNNHNNIPVVMMATLTPSECDSAFVMLLSHEKTIRYAQTQIKDGQIITGKSILDSALRQLSLEGWTNGSEEIESKRSQLIEDIRQTLEEIKLVRLQRQANLKLGKGSAMKLQG